MTYLLALFIPPLAFVAVGKPVQAIISLILCVTLIGWLPASVWALLVVHGAHADARTKRLEKAIREQKPAPSDGPSAWPGAPAG